MKKKYNITKKLLIKKYTKEEKSRDKIAKEFGCSPNTIKRRLDKYGIYIRTKSESAKKRKSKYNITKKFLVREYSNNSKTPEQLATELSCNQGVIKDRLKKYGIYIRTLSEAKRGKLIGKNSPGYIDGRCSKIYYCIESHCNKEICYETWKRGQGRCLNCAMRKVWKNKEHREKTLRASMLGRKIKPNKPEKQLNKLLSKLLPNEYKFVGDGKVIIGGFCPDFINCNGQKKIIEHYGDYWHTIKNRIERDKRRIVVYKKYGYKTLIVWEHELKNIKRVGEKIMEFNNV